MVTVRVQLFAALREALGRERLDLVVPAEVKVTALKMAIAQAATAEPEEQQHFTRLLTAPNVRLAVNQALTHGAELVLAEGDEVALLPPVTGG
ncbi:MAG: MoaD/ThiS family protein [Pseudomonadota bacterium]